MLFTKWSPAGAPDLPIPYDSIFIFYTVSKCTCADVHTFAIPLGSHGNLHVSARVLYSARARFRRTPLELRLLRQFHIAGYRSAAMKFAHMRPNLLQPSGAFPVGLSSRRGNWRRALHTHACYCPDNRAPRGLSAQPRQCFSASPPAESELTGSLLAYPPLETRQLQQDVSEDVLDAMRRTLSGMMGLLPSARWTVRDPLSAPARAGKPPSTLYVPLSGPRSPTPALRSKREGYQ